VALCKKMLVKINDNEDKSYEFEHKPFSDINGD